MYKVLLVDDEGIFLNHLRSAIFWNEQGCEICGEAGDGVAAVEAVKRLKPDIVFMDINLPKLDGLEASEQILSMPDPPHIIVLTAHGEFSFAYKAIKLGVFDYLLKPFDTTELVAALQKCIEDIERLKHHQSLKKTSEIGEIERYFMDMLELEQAGSPRWQPLFENSELIAVIVQVRDLRHDDLPRIREDILGYCNGSSGISSYITGIYNGGVVVIHTLEKNAGIEPLRSIYEGILASGAGQDSRYDCVALGSFVSSQEGIPQSYKLAVTALENRSRTGRAVVAYQDVEGLSSERGAFTVQDINLLIKLFEAGEYHQADEVIERIFALSQGQMLSFQYVISAYHSLLMAIHARYQYSDAKAWDTRAQKALTFDLNACVTTEEIVAVLKNNIHEVFSDCMNLQIPSKSDTLVRKIEKYLSAHYTRENLSVDQIAQALFFENSYVRRVYKTVTGKTIMHRLEEIRMERAKELLEGTDGKNSDIAAQVGYADPFYFSRRFKLYTNFSPTDYRNRFGARK